jgi:cell wall-associated NlpC family hydrolase
VLKHMTAQALRLKLVRILTVASVTLLPLAVSDIASASTEYTHTLQPGQRLYPGDILYSPSHAYRLIMQGDGNLVLYTGGTALWSSKTNGQTGANAVMQGDGNFVVYQAGKAIWNSGTVHHDGAILDMQDDGNLVIYWENTAIWSTGTDQPPAPQQPTPSPSPAQPGPAEYTHTLQPGQRLYPGDILYSPSHAYRLVMQGDGNLVLYAGGKALWSSKTNGHNGANAVMQGDGNLVVYRAGKALWSSKTNGHSGAILDMQDDGNLVIYWQGRALWASKDASASSRGLAIVRAAASQAGVPYCLGGGNQFGSTPCGGMPATFDCTGLTMYAVYKGTGKVLTHDGRQGLEGGKAIRQKNELSPGDLVFFGGGFGSFLHSGVYAGNGEFWDASNWGVPVRKHTMAWEEHGLAFVGGARYWH